MKISKETKDAGIKIGLDYERLLVEKDKEIELIKEQCEYDCEAIGTRALDRTDGGRRWLASHDALKAQAERSDKEISRLRKFILDALYLNEEGLHGLYCGIVKCSSCRGSAAVDGEPNSCLAYETFATNLINAFNDDDITECLEVIIKAELKKKA